MAKADLIYIGTDDGIITLSDPGGSGRWRRSGHSLQGHRVSSMLTLSALDLLAAVQGAGLQRSTDGGLNWQQVLADDVHALAMHADSPTTVYIATAAGDIRESTDSGQSWQPLTASTLHLLASAPPRLLSGEQWQRGSALPGEMQGLAFSPGRSDTLFAVAQGQVYRTGAGESWDTTTSNPAPCSGALAVLAGEPEVVLVAVAGPSGAALMRSETDGASWQAATLVDNGGKMRGVVSVIATVGHHRDQAWAGTTGGQVWHSPDRGRTWQNMAQDMTPIRSLVAARLA